MRQGPCRWRCPASPGLRARRLVAGGAESMAWEGSCRERVGWRALTVPGDDSRPLLTYMLPLFSVMMRLHARRLLSRISGGRSIVVKLEYQDKRLRRVFCCRNCLLTAGKNRPLLSAPAPLPPPLSPFLLAPPECLVGGGGARAGKGTGSSAVLTGLCLPGDSSALGAQEGAVPLRGVLHLWEHRIHWEVTALHQLGPLPGGKVMRLVRNRAKAVPRLF